MSSPEIADQTPAAEIPVADQMPAADQGEAGDEMPQLGVDDTAAPNETSQTADAALADQAPIETLAEADDQASPAVGDQTETVDETETADEMPLLVTAQQVAPQLEALLIMAEEALPSASLAEAVGAPVAVVEQALGELTEEYDDAGHGFMLRHVGGGWRYATRPQHHDLLARWVVEGQVNKLTQAGLETLAVIAYLQPVSRARISAVRGVNVDTAVRTLLARDLIAEEGSDEHTGAALLRTTDYFLERIGLGTLDELPPIAPRLPEAAALEAELAALSAEEPGDD